MENKFQSRTLEAGTRGYIFKEKNHRNYGEDLPSSWHYFRRKCSEKALKHSLEMFFDSKLGFDEQIKIIFDKSSKSIGLICKLRNILTRPSPRQICKSLVRPYLDYSETIYDKAFIVSFQQKLKSIQYNVALATTWTIRGICWKNLILS